VVFINFNTAYLDRRAYDVFAPNKERRDLEIKEHPGDWAAKRAIQQRYRKLLPPVPASAVLRMIDHVVKIAGADYVGFGSDFDGVSGMVPEGLEDVSKYPVLVKGMIDMGYSDSDIRKIAGGNLLRVMRAVEEAARQ
jgi:membrane dipeptidase